MDVFHGKPFPKDEVEFVLIGAGLPRTGTASTRVGMEMILPGKCHHMARVAADQSDRNVTHWLKAVSGDLTDDEWKKFIKDERLSTGVDYPISLFWKDLMRIYPNAKVLLNVRDPVRWYQSVKNTILNLVAIADSPLMRYNPLMLAFFKIIGAPNMADVPKKTCYAPVTLLGETWPKGMFGAVEDGETEAVRFFNAWKDEVIKEVPADRLLVWEVKNGWEPICKFLGVPVPKEPFPNVNDTSEQQKRISFMRRMIYGTWAVTIAGIASAAYLFV